MSEKRTKGNWQWIKGEKKTFFSILIVTIIVSQVIRVMEDSKKPQEPQIEASDLYLDYYQNRDTENVSLYLVNKSEIAIHRPNITIFIPRITKDIYIKRAFTVTGTGDCEVSKKNDSTLIADLSHKTIYPTFSNKRAYPVIDFKFKGATVNELKNTEKALEYTIICDEGEFKGKIPVFYIFSIR